MGGYGVMRAIIKGALRNAIENADELTQEARDEILEASRDGSVSYSQRMRWSGFMWAQEEVGNTSKVAESSAQLVCADMAKLVGAVSPEQSILQGVLEGKTVT